MVTTAFSYKLYKLYKLYSHVRVSPRQQLQIDAKKIYFVQTNSFKLYSANRTVYNGSNAPIWLKNMSKFSQCTRKKGTTGPPYLCLQQKCTAVSGRNVNKTYAYQHCFMFTLLPETFSSFSSLLLWALTLDIKIMIVLKAHPCR